MESLLFAIVNSRLFSDMDPFQRKHLTASMIRLHSIIFRLNVVEFSDDSTMLAGGFDDSAIRLWSLTPKKLRTLKTPFELEKIDKDAGEFLYCITVSCRTLQVMSNVVLGIRLAGKFLFNLDLNSLQGIECFCTQVTNNVSRYDHSLGSYSDILTYFV